MQEIPNWLKGYISSAGRDQIENAVKQAELKTSAEIVPVVVHRASTVKHVVLPLLLLGFIFAQLGFDIYSRELDPTVTVVASLMLALAFARTFAPMEWVERWLTPKSDQQQQVILRAELEFYESRIQQTIGATGVLIFVSLMEKQVVVLADKSINEKYPSETWQQAVDYIIQGIKSKNMADGIEQAISFIGETLKKSLPIQPGNTNELSNQLIIKEC